jgi:hypothetical protein
MMQNRIFGCRTECSGGLHDGARAAHWKAMEVGRPDGSAEGIFVAMREEVTTQLR